MMGKIQEKHREVAVLTESVQTTVPSHAPMIISIMQKIPEES